MDLVRETVGANVIEVENPDERLLDFVREQALEHEQLTRKLLIYTRDGEALFRRISGGFCERGCSLRLATLEDVFLKLTGRELRD